MNDNHDNYRPQSPDLSSYRPQPPQIPPYDAQTALPQGYNFSHRGSYDASPYFSPQTTQTSQSHFGQTSHPAQQPYTPQPFVPQQVQTYGQYPAGLVQSPLTGPANSFNQPHLPFPSGLQVNMPRRRKSEEFEEDDAYMPEASVQASGRSSKKRKPENANAAPPRTGPGPSLGIEVKTKFPVARIKRIMQADEDVGKVAQATPTAVSKALELFMITLVTKAASEAREKSSKRVTAAHLKQAVLSDENLDFLVEIVSKVADPTERKGRAKSDDSGDEGGGKKKKAGVGSRRKKVEPDDDD